MGCVLYVILRFIFRTTSAFITESVMKLHLIYILMLGSPEHSHVFCCKFNNMGPMNLAGYGNLLQQNFCCEHVIWIFNRAT
jgi:hypothetical protein